MALRASGKLLLCPVVLVSTRKLKLLFWQHQTIPVEMVTKMSVGRIFVESIQKSAGKLRVMMHFNFRVHAILYTEIMKKEAAKILLGNGK